MEDWGGQYKSKAREKLQKCNFQLSSFKPQPAAVGSDEGHQDFLKLVATGEVEKVSKYLRTHDSERVLKAVEKGSKKSCLHIAAKFGLDTMIEFCLNRGVAVDARDKLLKTPLMYACEYGKT